MNEEPVPTVGSGAAVIAAIIAAVAAQPRPVRRGRR